MLYFFPSLLLLNSDIIVCCKGYWPKWWSVGLWIPTTQIQTPKALGDCLKCLLNHVTTQLKILLWLPIAHMINPNSLTSPIKPCMMWPLPASLALSCGSFSFTMPCWEVFFPPQFFPHRAFLFSLRILEILFFLPETLLAFYCLCLDKFYTAFRTQPACRLPWEIFPSPLIRCTCG